jgi:DNA-binding transcriptional ArsR family regulator
LNGSKKGPPLRSAELSVGAILEQVKVEPANLSQHLSVLRQSHLVTTRKDANQVFYSLRDPLLIDVLDAMRKYFQNAVSLFENQESP